MAWSLAALMLIGLAVPLAVWGAEGLQKNTASTSYWDMDSLEDVESPDGYLPLGNDDLTSSSDNNYVIKYSNSTDDLHDNWNTGLYMTNETDQDYNEYIMSQDSDDDGEWAYMDYFTVGINLTTEQMIDNDTTETEVTIESPVNVTGNITLRMGGYDDAEEDSYITTIASEERNMTTNATTYTLDIEWSKLLDTDTEMGDENIMASISVELGPGERDKIEPSHVWKFDVKMNTDSAISAFWTAEVVAGLAGGLLIVSAIFATPWVDLSDLSGKRKGKFWR